jgi:hypothetical protein
VYVTLLLPSTKWDRPLCNAERIFFYIKGSITVSMGRHGMGRDGRFKR